MKNTKKTVNKLKNEYASGAGMDAQIIARPF